MRKKTKLVMSMFLSILMVFTLGITAFAADTQSDVTETEGISTDSGVDSTTQEDPAVEPAPESESPQEETLPEPPPVDSDEQIGDIAPDTDYVNNPMTLIDEATAEDESNFVEADGDDLTFNPRARSMFRFDSSFSQTGVLNSSNPNDMFFFSIESYYRKVVFRATSTNSKTIAALYTVDWGTGNLSMIGYADANQLATVDINQSMVNLYGLDYAIVFLTLDGSASDYTGSANIMSPTGGRVLYSDSTLANVTVGINNTVYTNGNNILAGADLSWEREFTFYHGSAGGAYDHYEQQMSVYSIGTMYHGTYSSTKYNVPNALIIEIDSCYERYFESHYNNVLGQVTRWTSQVDPNGTLTPATLYGLDHCGYLVIDLTTNSIVDWANTVHNYWYTRSGEKVITLSGSPF